MKILLVSDSHGHNDAYTILSSKYSNMDRYFDLGDSQTIADIQIEPFITVKGNCDYKDYPLIREFALENITFYLTHKPTISLCNNHPKPMIVIHGHTHIPKFEFIDNVLWLCPGSLTRPRSVYGCTYMVLDIEDYTVTATLHSYETDEVLYKQTVLLNHKQKI